MATARAISVLAAWSAIATSSTACGSSNAGALDATVAGDSGGAPDGTRTDGAVAPGACEEIITVGDDSTAPSVSFGPNGELHVLFFRPTDSAHVYATNISGEWSLESIAADSRNQGSTIAVHSDGTVHAFFDRYTYATRGASGWTTELVSTISPSRGQSFATGVGGSVTVDSSGRPHISYAARASNFPHDVMYLTRSGDTWVFEGAAVKTVRTRPRIRLSPTSGEAVIGYTYTTTSTTTYLDALRQDGDSWQSPGRTEADQGARAVGFDVGMDGVAYASVRTNARDFAFATSAASDWQVEDLAPSTFDGAFVLSSAMATDDQGDFHVVAEAIVDGERRIYYAKKSDGNWQVRQVPLALEESSACGNDCASTPAIAVQDGQAVAVLQAGVPESDRGLRLVDLNCL